MCPRDITPNNQDFAQQFPILATHVGLPEPLAWAQFQVAVLIHDTERTPRTLFAMQTAHHEWTAAYYLQEGVSP